MHETALLALAALLALLALPARAMPIPQKPATRSLNGPWRFKLEQGTPTATGYVPRRLDQRDPITTPETFEPFYETGYREDAAWHDLAVPGNWEMAGFSPATYDNPDNASGFYRKWFEVPAGWAGQRVLVNFDGVQNGAEVFLNGHPVDVSEPSWGRANYHEGSWTAWQADLTPFIRFGERNLLALRVTKNTKSVDLDTGDYFFLGGIHRPVTLFAVPKTHIADLTVQTSLRPEGGAEVRVSVQLSEGAPVTVAARLGDEPEQAARAGADGTARLTFAVKDPRLWSAEHPNLYPLTVTLRDTSGEPAETVTRRVGIREITIKDGVLLVNGVPVKLTGMCRHDVYPTEGTAVGEDVWRKDLELMKAANVNAIRTSHYPYGSGFYDLCDEMGFYVMDELPYCWCNPDTPEMAPAFLQRARETLRRDKDHPSVILWAIGNENRAGKNLQSVADLVKALDPTRPRLVSWFNADKYGTDLDDFHYLPPAEVKKRLKDADRRAKWPLISLENPNDWEVRNGADYGCLDLWAQVMKRSWDVVWPDDRMAGQFLWEWQDRAIADRCPEKHYAYDPATGIQYAKTKGIVDGYRHPRPEYYHVKMVYAPIVLGDTAAWTSNPPSAVLDVANRYSFTDLSELKTTWHLLRGGKAIRRGTARLALAPRTRAKVTLSLPEDVRDADTLRLVFDDPRGWNVATYTVPLRPRTPEAPVSAPLPPGLPFPAFNLITRTMDHNPYKWETAVRHAGRLVNVTMQPASANAGAPLAQTRAMEGDIVMEEAPDTVVGHVQASFDGHAFRYTVDWTGPKADLQEIGWTFTMPKRCDRIAWKREALWSWYPESHIGRPEGTAKRATMDARNTDLDRPDAFDYNSTKYDCDWAALVGPDGHGLRVEFDPAMRHHVRGGVAENGDALLTVNRFVCPPRDLSSNIVPDLYRELTPGAVVMGEFRLGSR